MFLESGVEAVFNTVLKTSINLNIEFLFFSKCRIMILHLTLVTEKTHKIKIKQ